MSEVYEYPTLDEIKLAVAEVVDTYYAQLVNYLDTKFSNVQLGFDYISGLIGSISSNLIEHRKVEDTIATINSNVLAIKSDMDCIEKAIRDLDSHLAGYYSSLADAIATKLWEKAPDDFKWFFRGWNKLMEKYFGISPQDPPGIFEDIANFFGNISNALSSIVNFFQNLWNEINTFINDPWGYLRDRIIGPIWNGLQWLGQQIYSGLQWLWDRIVDFGNWVWNALQNVGQAIYNALKGFGEWVYNALKGGIDWFMENIIKAPLRAAADTVSNAVKSVLEDALKSSGEKGEFFVLLAVPLQFLPYMAGMLAPGYIFEEVPKIIEVEGEGSAKGLASGIALKALVKPGKILEWLGKTFRTIGEKVTEGFMLGVGLNLLDPYKYLIRPVAKQFASPLYKNVLGVDAFFELPSESQLEKFMQRTLPLKILADLGANISDTTATIVDET